MAFIEKPIPSKEVLDEMLEQLHRYVSRTVRHMLVALKDEVLRGEVTGMLQHSHVQCTAVASLAGVKARGLRPL
jgi:hypothetical protein